MADNLRSRLGQLARHITLNSSDTRRRLTSPTWLGGAERRDTAKQWQLTDTDLDAADLSQRCLIGAYFVRCNLRGVDFSDADLSYASFVDCDLYTSNFTGTVLYAAQFKDCDLTKADFTDSLLNGVRFKDVDITHTVFDTKASVGLVRKPVKVATGAPPPAGYLRADFGQRIGRIRTLEARHGGIYCREFDRAIRFSVDDRSERWRRWRRKEEIVKIIKLLLLSNGYYERALGYYYLERKFRRKAMTWRGAQGVRRAVDFITGELLWAYGTSIVRPLAAYLTATVGSALALVWLPHIQSSSGVVASSAGDAPVGRLDGHLLLNVCNYLLTSAFGNDSFEPVGLGRIVFLLYAVFSLIVLSLVFSSTARRLANI